MIILKRTSHTQKVSKILKSKFPKESFFFHIQNIRMIIVFFFSFSAHADSSKIQSSKSRIGIIPTRTNKEIFKNRILDLNIPGKELNVNKIHRANNFFPQKNDNRSH